MKLTRVAGWRRQLLNADRLVNRLWTYPRHLRRWRSHFDVFHIVDHSYAQLVHALPPGRTGVFCHDLDAFRCLLEPGQERRPLWFRVLARHVLAGLASCRRRPYLGADRRSVPLLAADPERLGANQAEFVELRS